MKVGLHIAATTWEGGTTRLGAQLAEVVEVAEAAGFDAVSVTDHVWGHPYTGGVTVSQVEAYTTLAFIAARTRRVLSWLLPASVAIQAEIVVLHSPYV